MIVQGSLETAADFAKRLEKVCLVLSKKYKKTILNNPIIIVTSASDGRQTATIQFPTRIKD